MKIGNMCMRLLDKLCAVMEFLLASHVVFRSEVDKYKVLVGEIPFFKIISFRNKILSPNL